MNNLNSILLEGILSDGPALVSSPGAESTCDFVLESERLSKVGDAFEKEVSYFDVQARGRLAEVCNEYLQKGRGVRIVGRIKQERWEERGKTKSRVFILAEHVEFKPQKNSM